MQIRAVGKKIIEDQRRGVKACVCGPHLSAIAHNAVVKFRSKQLVVSLASYVLEQVLESITALAYQQSPLLKGLCS